MRKEGNDPGMIIPATSANILYEWATRQKNINFMNDHFGVAQTSGNTIPKYGDFFVNTTKL